MPSLRFQANMTVLSGLWDKLGDRRAYELILLVSLVDAPWLLMCYVLITICGARGGKHLLAAIAFWFLVVFLLIVA
jgi:hypothetical protein